MSGCRSNPDPMQTMCWPLPNPLWGAWPLRTRRNSPSSVPSQRAADEYLDPFRNGFGQTVVAPYSVRVRPKAPVSAPLEWSEVRPELVPSDFNLGNFRQRLARTDPWQDFFKSR